MEGDRGASAGAQIASFTPADRPVTAVGAHGDGPLSVNGLPGHAKVPVCFISNLKHDAHKPELDRQQQNERQNKTFF